MSGHITSRADVFERLADLFGAGDQLVSCPLCGKTDFDGPGLLSHMFRRCDADPASLKKYASDAEIVAACRKTANSERGAQ